MSNAGCGRSLPRLISAALLLMILTACELALVDVEQAVTIYRGEKWEGTMTVRLPPDTIELLGSAEQATTDIEAEFVNEYLAQLEQAGVSVAWEASRNELGELVYFFQLEGEGLESLKQAMFDEDTQLYATVVDGKRQIVFSHRPGVSGLFIRDHIIRLTGGKVLSSNGNLVTDGTVEWVDPSGRVEAVITERPRFDLISILLPVACGLGFFVLAAVSIGAILRLARARKLEAGS